MIIYFSENCTHLPPLHLPTRIARPTSLWPCIIGRIPVLISESWEGDVHRPVLISESWENDVHRPVLISGSWEDDAHRPVLISESWEGDVHRPVLISGFLGYDVSGPKTRMPNSSPRKLIALALEYPLVLTMPTPSTASGIRAVSVALTKAIRG